VLYKYRAVDPSIDQVISSVSGYLNIGWFRKQTACQEKITSRTVIYAVRLLEKEIWSVL